ncbi:Respiration factor [Lachnellula occidentalis]|uniref:Respiration factor n=1 Tax=Lachnellula occidentalis TaxID=215460 RepID=A0A8H8S9B9_9HELO|nr:Respiration factor [Lachnellula occidentalis]
MDSSQYHPNPMSNNNPSYQSLPNISPHQLQHNSLPPLQNAQHAAAMQPMYGSAPHTPRTPVTPNTPGAVNNMGNFSQMNGQQSRGYPQMMPGGGYQQPPQQYRASSSMMPQSSTAMSHPQPIAPAPAQSRMPQALRPMPPNGMHMGQPMGSPYGQSMMMQEMDPPTHVVGSQGRRGILPSAPGRPSVTATGTGSTKNAMIPAKDADGKFPCPHCTKTYLHAKHLKRHLLRHTGDRPYMCVLCRDTFSRSDILKRHFQKCSIRRGNPTGASHLSHAQAHLKKSHPGPHKSTPSMSSENDIMGSNGMNSLADPALHPFGVIADGSVPDAGSNLTNEQAEQIRNGSTVGGSNGRSLSGPGGSNRASFDQSYAGGTLPPGMNPSLAYNISSGLNGHQGFDFASHGNGVQPHPATSMPTVQNGRSGYPVTSAGQQQNLNGWQPMYQANPQAGFMNSYNQSINTHHVPIKSEPSNNSSSTLYSGVYSSAVNGLAATVSDFPTWHNLQNDPLQSVSSRLIIFCFPNNQIIGRSNDIRKYLSAEYIKHFLELFSNFQGHLPIIHMPTFATSEAYDGLLLGMICVGAVYSDRITPSQVRDMVELSKAVIERNSSVLASLAQDQSADAGLEKEPNSSSKAELEQITAIFLMQMLSTWHGTPVQREMARMRFPTLVALARRADLTTPMTTSATTPFSVLHQRHVKVENFNSVSFDWNAWVEQEKRSRLIFGIFLMDATMVLYFNTPPLFDALEIRVPLPADDAAWDARTSTQCAEALGLHGPSAARDINMAGSRRPKQPEMHSAIETLMRPELDLQPGTTNLYSKFILIHALHVQLWAAQKQLSQEPNQSSLQNYGFPSSTSSTPLSQNDWVVRGMDGTGSGGHSASSSGRATPVEAAGQSPSMHQLKTASIAFEKWKQVWDEDIAIQYPPSSTSYRRFGFCRDGVHFYWLGKYLMKNSRGTELQMAPDQRFAQVMHLLKYVKNWVASDSVKRGEEPGSVSDIDKDYGSKELTLDMAQLFKPINKQIDSPVAGVHTGGSAMQ